MRLLPILLILAASHAEASSEFPTGTVVESGAIRAEPSQTCALYLPRDYTPDKKWPILYCLDAVGRGQIPIQLFRDTAEKLGYILVIRPGERERRG